MEVMTNMVIGRVLSIDELFEDGLQGRIRRLRRRSAHVYAHPRRGPQGRLLRQRVPDPDQPDEGLHRGGTTRPSSGARLWPWWAAATWPWTRARCAKRMGAEHVYIVYRRGEDGDARPEGRACTTPRKRALSSRLCTTLWKSWGMRTAGSRGMECIQHGAGRARRLRPPPSGGDPRQRVCPGRGHRDHGPGHQPQPPDPLHHPGPGDQQEGLPHRRRRRAWPPPGTAYLPAAMPSPAQLPSSWPWVPARRALRPLTHISKRRDKPDRRICGIKPPRSWLDLSISGWKSGKLLIPSQIFIAAEAVSSAVCQSGACRLFPAGLIFWGGWGKLSAR